MLCYQAFDSMLFKHTSLHRSHGFCNVRYPSLQYSARSILAKLVRLTRRGKSVIIVAGPPHSELFVLVDIAERLSYIVIVVPH